MADPQARSTRPPLRRSRRERIVAGVAGGIAEYFEIDPLLVRLGFVVLALAGGGGVVIYLIAWLVMPEEGEEGAETAGSGERRGVVDPETTRLFIGGALIAVGGLILAARFIPHFMAVFWPLVLIGAGLAVLVGRRR